MFKPNYGMWSAKRSVMKKLIAAMKRAPKRYVSTLVVAAAILVPAGLFAWGPSDRPTYTNANPADHVVFNSITDNPNHGDERNFVQIRDVASGEDFTEEVNLKPGKEYEVYVYYHNNADEKYNEPKHNYKGVAKDAFMRTQMPATVKAGEKARITGFVGASNAQPGQVWDEAYGVADQDYALRYVPNSATIHNNGATNGAKLSNDLYKDGTPLGYDELDGKLPGCYQYSGYVTYKFKVDQPNFEVTKQVSKAGENKYSNEVTTTAGSEVEYKIQYKNTGTTQQNNVVIKDQLPEGVSYVNGSTQIANSKTGGQWSNSESNEVTKGGLNLGNYSPNGNVYVKFKAKIANADKLECGINTLVNKAIAETNNGTKHDTATVKVKKECEEPPVEKCPIPGKEHLPKDSPDCKEEEEMCPIPGKEHLPKDSDQCKEDVEYCPIPGKEELPKDSPDCKEEVEYCPIEGKEDLPVDSEECKEDEVPVEKCPIPGKEHLPKDSADCKEEEDMCPIKGKEHLPADSEKCEETPVTPETPETPETPKVPETPVKEETPAELPQTGAGDKTAVALGIGAIIAAIGYAVTGRRALS